MDVVTVFLPPRHRALRAVDAEPGGGRSELLSVSWRSLAYETLICCGATKNIVQIHQKIQVVELVIGRVSPGMFVLRCPRSSK